MPVSRNKRKDGKRHKPKRRYLMPRELIGATLLGRQLAKEAHSHKHDETVTTIDIVNKAFGKTEEHADEQRESESPATSESSD